MALQEIVWVRDTAGAMLGAFITGGAERCATSHSIKPYWACRLLGLSSTWSWM
jgi:hypothetical protein